MTSERKSEDRDEATPQRGGAKTERTIWPNPTQPPVRLFATAVVVLAAALLVSCLVIAYVLMFAPMAGGYGRRLTFSAPAHHEQITGPWGMLEVTPIILDYPTSHTPFDFDLEPYRRWVFHGCTADTIRRQLLDAGVTARDAEGLLACLETNAAGDEAILRAPDAIVAGFSPAVRNAWYARLAHDPANQPHVRPFMFRCETIEEWFADSGVTTDVLKKIRPLLYRRDNYLLFSDLQLVPPEITSRFERVALYRALHRTATLRVRVFANDPLTRQAVCEYWGHPNRVSEIEPLLVATADGMSVLSFLPPFARERLYTYFESQPNGDEARRDCNWSTLNFFNAQPDNSVTTNVIGILQQQYEAITCPTQLGDVVLLFHGERLAHSCVYIADDIVFTKNGIGTGNPFVLEKLEDVQGRYRCIYGDIRTTFCRRKGS